MRLWESSAPAEKETGKGLPSQSLALARFAGRYPSRPSIAAHRAVLSRMEGMRTRSSVVWICSAMAERASIIIYTGAEFTKAWANEMGSKIFPDEYAVATKTIEIHEDKPIE